MLRFAKRNNVWFVKLATIFGFDLMKKGRRPRLCLHVAWIISTDVVWEENCLNHFNQCGSDFRCCGLRRVDSETCLLCSTVDLCGHVLSNFSGYNVTHESVFVNPAKRFLFFVGGWVTVFREGCRRHRWNGWQNLINAAAKVGSKVATVGRSPEQEKQVGTARRRRWRRKKH